jgi:hypothetical protein
MPARSVETPELAIGGVEILLENDDILFSGISLEKNSPPNSQNIADYTLKPLRLYNPIREAKFYVKGRVVTNAAHRPRWNQKHETHCFLRFTFFW